MILNYKKPNILIQSQLDSVVFTPIKRCPKCGEIKPFSEFYKDKDRRFGINCSCKECIKIRDKKYYEKNSNEIKEKHKKYREKNSNEINERRRKKYEKNSNEINERCRKKYQEKNYDKIKEREKKNREKNSNEIKKERRRKKTENQKRYREKNYDKIKERERKNREKNHDKIKIYNRERYAKNPIVRVSCLVRSRIQKVLKQKTLIKNKRTLEILGTTFENLTFHLESQFKDGMTWENQDKVWHIDHKVPLSLAKTEEEVYKLNHHTNLQPLWAEENLSKHKKLLPEYEQLYINLLNR
jgi:hypothetical protein